VNSGRFLKNITPQQTSISYTIPSVCEIFFKRFLAVSRSRFTHRKGSEKAFFFCRFQLVQGTALDQIEAPPDSKPSLNIESTRSNAPMSGADPSNPPLIPGMYRPASIKLLVAARV
jgi:hypothetical protein